MTLAPVLPPPTTALPNSYSQIVIGDTPTLYWKLEDTATSDAYDFSGHNHLGTYLGQYIQNVPGALMGERSRAVFFNAPISYSYVVSKDQYNDDPTQWSIEFWFQNSVPSGCGLFCFQNTSLPQTATQYDRSIYMAQSGQLIFVCNQAAPTFIITPQAYNDGAWHHVVALVGGGQQALYVDGQLILSIANNVGSTTSSGYWLAAFGQVNPATFPDVPFFSNFVGTLDEVAVYTYALSATQVVAHYQAGVSPPPTLTSDAMPLGGYILPLFPPGWLNPSQPNARMLFAPFDRALDGARLGMQTVLSAHKIDEATGANLDDLGAILGVQRAAGEQDGDYRTRIKSTAHNGVSAANNNDMADYLTNMTGLPVSVLDGPGAATFTVTFQGYPRNASTIVPTVRRIKAAGTVPIVQARIIAKDAPGGTLLGAFTLGSQILGGKDIFIALQ